jgi:hypothetical protein
MSDSHSDPEVDSLFTEIESEYKTLVAGLDTAIKGLKLLNKKVKKASDVNEVVVPEGKSKGKKLTDVLDLAVGIAKKSKKSYGSAVLEELH